MNNKIKEILNIIHIKWDFGRLFKEAELQLQLYEDYDYLCSKWKGAWTGKSFTHSILILNLSVTKSIQCRILGARGV